MIPAFPLSAKSLRLKGISSTKSAETSERALEWLMSPSPSTLFSIERIMRRGA